jgi:hypothetical protein
MASSGTLSSNGTTNVAGIGGAQSVPGAFNTVYLWGTFDGATVEVKVSPDGSEYFDVADASFTDKGFANVQARFEVLALTVSSAGASTSVQYVVL